MKRFYNWIMFKFAVYKIQIKEMIRRRKLRKRAPHFYD